METLAGQFQRLSDKILVVRDGFESLCYNNSSEIPPYLKFEACRRSEVTSVEEYHYRCTTNDSAYVFFDKRVSDWLQGPKTTTLSLSVADRLVPHSVDQNPVKVASYPERGNWGVVKEEGEEGSSSSGPEEQTLAGRMLKINTSEGIQRVDEIIELP